MKVRKILACILAFAMILSTMSFTAFADADIIEVGAGKDYETWSAALAAATDADLDGVITYHVYGQVAMDSHIVGGAAATINIVGMTEDAELLIETSKPDDNGVVYVSDNAIETVNFSNLKLSRPNGAWRGNEAHHNCFFTVWDSDVSTDLITYTKCVFPYGSGNNQYGKTTYTGCTFNNDTYYALWIYGRGSNASVEVTGCTFVADRGVKIYAEDASATVNTKITTSTFDVASKPAIVSSIAGSLEIEEVDATACEYGLLASEPKDGRTDLTAAAVTVDGETPVYAAQVGTLLCTDVDYAQAEAKGKEIVVAGDMDLIEDLVLTAPLKVTSDITINGNGYTIKGADITVAAGDAWDKAAVTPIIVNGAILTLNNVTVEGGTCYNDIEYANDNSYGLAGNAIEVTDGTLNINDSTIKGGATGTMYTKSAGNAIVSTNSTVNVNNSYLASGELLRDDALSWQAIVADEVSSLSLIDVELYTPASTWGTNVVISAMDNGNPVVLQKPVYFDGNIKVSGGNVLENINYNLGPNVTFTGKIDPSLIADTLTINYVKKDVDENKNDNQEVYDLYDIVIKGQEKYINRLNAVDLTFALENTSGLNTYEIISSNDEITINKVYNPEDGSVIEGRYEFHYEGKTDTETDTAKEIIIGQVKIDGYGEYTFNVAEAGTNVAYATKTADNIVSTFIPDGQISNGNGVFDVETNSIVAKISVPKRDLTINVSFPNAIEENAYAYQNMKITVTGPDKYVKVIYLGNGDTVQENGDCLPLKNGGYSTVISGELTLNSPYTVTLEGAGYRTVKYTVNMTEAKTLNFWNNVKDNAKAVEVSESSVEKYVQKVTFLAGDIVKDNDINVYDLSAVVSYFGEIDLDENNKPEYAKYDLNRDGKIDSKDVAYVLVSWGN